MSAQLQYRLDTAPCCVLVDGPQEIDGDGGIEYVVCFANDNGEPITENPKAVWICWDGDDAINLGRELAKRYRLELVSGAMPA